MPIQPILRGVPEPTSDENFKRIGDALSRTNAVNNSEPVSADLAAGDNAITTPGKTHAKGRIVVYQSAAADLFDKGVDASGRWVINASAPCTVLLIFI